MTDGLSEALAEIRAGRLTPEQIRTQQQEALAREGRAENQCEHCGSYRGDGRPPILHERGCPSYGVMPGWSLPGGAA